MAIWLKRIGSAQWGKDKIDIAQFPCPTVMALGIAGRRRDQYCLEFDGEDIDGLSAYLRMTGNPRFGGGRNIDLDESPCPAISANGISATARQYYVEITRDKRVALMPTSKPPFHIPTMQEIVDLKPNSFNVVSLFAGCGGSSTGYRMAGFKVLLASEFIPEARESYAANKAPHTIIDPRDIRNVSGKDLLRQIGLAAGELDVLDGSPPCASFSTAGKREKGWGKVKEYSGTTQRTDDLFFEYARIVDEMRPKVFVAENVSGLVKGTAKGYFIEIMRKLKGLGYAVNAQLLDAQWLGVPQARQRIIFMGVRNDLGLKPTFPKPFPYRYSVKEAIPWLDKARITGRTGPQFCRVESETHHPMNTIMAQDNDYVIEETDISRFAIGKEWDNVKQASLASVVHPIEKRKFTIEELKRICSFPDDFILKGTYAQQWERLGRAVPPLMMKAIAETVASEILSRIQD